MGQLKVASRYAKSLLSLAKEKGLTQEVKADVALIAKTIDASRDLRALLNSPVIREDKKNSILKEIFASQINDLTFRFFKLLTEKGRESAIEAVCDAYTLAYRELNNILQVRIISASKLEESTKAEIISKLGDSYKTLEIVEEINPELIGGFIVKIGDKQIDASVLGSFNKLKKEFKHNPFVANF